MFTCRDCGRIFDDPMTWDENLGLPPRVRISGCPYCGGNYDETICCDGCLEPIRDDYIRIRSTGQVFCRDCVQKVEF